LKWHSEQKGGFLMAGSFMSVMGLIALVLSINDSLRIRILESSGFVQVKTKVGAKVEAKWNNPLYLQKQAQSIQSLLEHPYKCGVGLFCGAALACKFSIVDVLIEAHAHSRNLSYSLEAVTFSALFLIMALFLLLGGRSAAQIMVGRCPKFEHYVYISVVLALTFALTFGFVQYVRAMDLEISLRISPAPTDYHTQSEVTIAIGSLRCPSTLMRSCVCLPWESTIVTS
jgi:hypothetical protein